MWRMLHGAGPERTLLQLLTLPSVSGERLSSGLPGLSDAALQADALSFTNEHLKRARYQGEPGAPQTPINERGEERLLLTLLQTA